MKQPIYRNPCPECVCGRDINNKPHESIDAVMGKVRVITDDFGDQEIFFPAGTCGRIRREIIRNLIGVKIT